MIYYLLAGLALLYLIIVHPWSEHMTNADVKKKQDFHASKPTEWAIPKAEETHEAIKPKSTKKKASIDHAIRGPTVTPLDPNAPQPTIGTGKNGTGEYPDIYGPELLKEPGHADLDFLPASEFPPGPPVPSPYLNDFSKILKM
jgi:hypothetical protein